MNEVQFARVPGLELFCEASSEGQIFSVARLITKKNGVTYNVQRKLLSQKTNRSGYKAVAFWVDGKRKMFLVHRLVLMAFVPQEGARSQVNHKNGIRSDNRIENLEWCTQSENSLHAFRVLNARRGSLGRLGRLHPRSMRVIGTHTKTGNTVLFDGLMEAQRSGFLACCISECINGTQKTHREMIWQKA
jgi:hypothetical protein